MQLVANDRPIRPRKTHTAEFKEKVVKAFLNTSTATYTEVGRKFGEPAPRLRDGRENITIQALDGSKSFVISAQMKV